MCSTASLKTKQINKTKQNIPGKIFAKYEYPWYIKASKNKGENRPTNIIIIKKKGYRYEHFTRRKSDLNGSQPNEKYFL